MCIAGLVGFIISAQFVTAEGFELPYYELLIGAAAIKLVSRTPTPSPALGAGLPTPPPPVPAPAVAGAYRQVVSPGVQTQGT
jgi:hypothetical protein